MSSRSRSRSNMRQPTADDSAKSPLRPVSIPLPDGGQVTALGTFFDDAKYLKVHEGSSDVTIYAPGFTVVRMVPSYKLPEKPLVRVTARIDASSRGPVFIVSAEDDAENPVARTQPTAAWVELLSRGQTASKRVSVVGVERYGLHDPKVMAALQSLPGAAAAVQRHREASERAAVAATSGNAPPAEKKQTRITVMLQSKLQAKLQTTSASEPASVAADSTGKQEGHATGNRSDAAPARTASVSAAPRQRKISALTSAAAETRPSDSTSDITATAPTVEQHETSDSGATGSGAKQTEASGPKRTKAVVAKAAPQPAKKQLTLTLVPTKDGADEKGLAAGTMTVVASVPPTTEGDNCPICGFAASLTYCPVSGKLHAKKRPRKAGDKATAAKPVNEQTTKAATPTGATLASPVDEQSASIAVPAASNAAERPSGRASTAAVHPMPKRSRSAASVSQTAPTDTANSSNSKATKGRRADPARDPPIVSEPAGAHESAAASASSRAAAARKPRGKKDSPHDSSAALNSSAAAEATPSVKPRAKKAPAAASAQLAIAEANAVADVDGEPSTATPATSAVQKRPRAKKAPAAVAATTPTPATVDVIAVADIDDGLSCAATPTTTGAKKRPRVAKVQPVGASPADGAAVDVDAGPSAVVASPASSTAAREKPRARKPPKTTTVHATSATVEHIDDSDSEDASLLEKFRQFSAMNSQRADTAVVEIPAADEEANLWEAYQRWQDVAIPPAAAEDVAPEAEGAAPKKGRRADRGSDRPLKGGAQPTLDMFLKPCAAPQFEAPPKPVGPRPVLGPSEQREARHIMDRMLQDPACEWPAGVSNPKQRRAYAAFWMEYASERFKFELLAKAARESAAAAASVVSGPPTDDAAAGDAAEVDGGRDREEVDGGEPPAA